MAVGSASIGQRPGVTQGRSAKQSMPHLLPPDDGEATHVLRERRDEHELIFNPDEDTHLLTQSQPLAFQAGLNS